MVVQGGRVIELRYCRYCRSEENLTIDHMIPKSIGGKNEVKNYQCLCKRCNEIKSGLSHKQVKTLFAWHDEINQKRLSKDKRLI